MSRPITWISALEQAKRLVGSFANCKPSDPDQFAESVARVLEKYPAGLVDVCCDPQRGLALKVQFLSIMSLGDWLDEHLRHYQLAMSPAPRRVFPALPDNPEMAERCAALLTDLAEQLRASNSRSPLDMLLDRRAAMRRESIDRILAYAARIAPRDAKAE